MTSSTFSPRSQTWRPSLRLSQNCSPRLIGMSQLLKIYKKRPIKPFEQGFKKPVKFYLITSNFTSSQIIFLLVHLCDQLVTQRGKPVNDPAPAQDLDNRCKTPKYDEGGKRTPYQAAIRYPTSQAFGKGVQAKALRG